MFEIVLWRQSDISLLRPLWQQMKPFPNSINFCIHTVKVRELSECFLDGWGKLIANPQPVILTLADYSQHISHLTSQLGQLQKVRSTAVIEPTPVLNVVVPATRPSKRTKIFSGWIEPRKIFVLTNQRRPICHLQDIELVRRAFLNFKRENDACYFVSRVE